ncbi:PAS domain-containing hybrid sensor histidine kinase/response regulator [Ramlibacter rhizophilus]|uniref:histidine kinase n=1 Tax=Ramlibacter rhizophilus TaxID=1781167 RepID=A0A4Z0C3N5_9BURK|nr:PAS domain S-box protein [Ramlibacter rhizophilus]TFZ04819.1 PAS domain S-box protein [Ramlibacter rhizophilus]
MSAHPRPPLDLGSVGPAGPTEPLLRLALASAHPGGPGLFADLATELAAALQAPAVLAAVFDGEEPSHLQSLALCVDGELREGVDLPVTELPCVLEPGRAEFRYVAQGLRCTRLPARLAAREDIDACASHALRGSSGEVMGVLLVLDTQPVAGGDPRHAQAALGVIAARMAAELERQRTEAAMRAVALAVSAAPSGTVFDELARMLAAILHADIAFIARCEGGTPRMMKTLALVRDGQVVQGGRYALAGTPCDTVLGKRFQAYPQGLQQQFPEDEDARIQHLESYAGYPLVATDGTTLGVISIASRRPLTQVDRVRATLEILSVRAAAEVERLRADERQRRSLEDLRQREEQYRAVFESSLDGLFVWDEQLRVVDVNPAGLALYGAAREDVIGATLFPDSLPAGYVQARLAPLRDALAGRTSHLEATLLRKDGGVFDADLRVMPFRQGGRAHAFMVVRDITQRRRGDQILRDSEEQYRTIFNASVDALVLRSADFRIVDVNATYEAMSGFSRAQVLGLDRVLANPPEVSAEIRGLHQRALAGHTVRLETVLLRRDGHRYELELRGVPILHRGQPHVLYIGRDITQAKRAERALRDSEEQYRAIFNASADSLVLRDANYRAVEVNPAYTTLSGFTRDEVIAADRVLTQVDPELRRRHRAEHELALAGRPLRFEVTGTRKDGSTWQGEVRGTPMSYRGRPHVLYAVRDITDRIAAETRRAELERQLRQSQKMEAIGQLTGGLAHDFNNLLTSVLGYVAMAQERPGAAADPALARQLAQARLAAERARDHVAQLLAFSRPHRGERRLVTAADLARGALELLRPNLPSSIGVEFLPHAAEGAPLPPVHADPVQMEQVLMNLCLNARDAMGEHGTLRIGLAACAGSGHCASCAASLEGTRWVCLEVKDNGRGMGREVLDRMFEPFFTTKEAGRGTGMGLAMVHGIVHDHGGHIQVESAPGQGASFRVLLPAAEAEAGARTAAAADTSAPLAPLRGQVLLVEDEPMVGDYLHELMAGWGLGVILERDPLAAARRLDRQDDAVDLLVTDHTMPGMTGLALARHARQARPGLRVVLHTGNEAGIAAGELAPACVDAILRKPVDPQALRELLRGLLAP